MMRALSVLTYTSRRRCRMRLNGSSAQMYQPLGSSVMPDALSSLRRRLSIAQSSGDLPETV